MYKLAEIQIESLPEKNKGSILEMADYSIIWDFSKKTIEKSHTVRRKQGTQYKRMYELFEGPYVDWG